MENITAPYGFVPLAESVFLPEWQPSQDEPFEDGVYGTLDYAIEALGPLFTRGSGPEGAPSPFFKTPDGKPAIPGSSVRGMLRNVLQIAAFGRFNPVNNHRYGLRDLQNRDLYGKYMSEIDPEGDGAGALIPLVSAGWMTKSSDPEFPASIQPVSFAKIEYGFLQKLNPRFEPGRKQTAPDKYTRWGSGSREVNVHLYPRKGAAIRRGPGDYSIVRDLGGPTKGTLVFTGQPSESRPGAVQGRGAGKPKHHDFVFHEKAGPEIRVPKQLFDDFEFVHSDRGQQGRNRSAPNAEWGHWFPKFAAGQAVPVFFLPGNKGQVRSIGLAMMFRLAYRNSIGELADENQPDRNSAAPDLAELVYGRVKLRSEDGDEEEDLKSFKGRISIGLASLTGTPRTGPAVEAVLGGPKATFYPNYVEQSAKPELEPGALPRRVGGKPAYKTYQDDDARLRGWKRYRPQEAQRKPALPDKASERVKTRFQPLETGSVFTGRIRLHNLREVELGALLWSLDYGGAPGAEHMLGMARSLGYGRVRLRVTKWNVVTNKGSGAVDATFGARCVAAFEKAMGEWATREGVIGGWKGSAQLAELIACAKPLPAGSEAGLHLSLNHTVDRNQFVLAKKDGLALRSISGWRAPAGAGDAPRAVHASAAVPAPAPARPAPPPPPPPEPTEATVDFLVYDAGRREWSGAAMVGGVRLQLRGADNLEGLTPEEKKARKSGKVTCTLQPVGRGTFKIVAVKR